MEEEGRRRRGVGGAYKRRGRRREVGRTLRRRGRRKIASASLAACGRFPSRLGVSAGRFAPARNEHMRRQASTRHMTPLTCLHMRMAQEELSSLQMNEVSLTWILDMESNKDELKYGTSLGVSMNNGQEFCLFKPVVLTCKQ